LWTAVAGILLLAGEWVLPLAITHAQTGAASVRGQVIDEDGQPVSRAEVTIHFGVDGSSTIYTDDSGRFDVAIATPFNVHLTISKPGFFRIDNRAIELVPGANEVSITLNHETEIQEKLEVQSSPIQIDPESTSHQESIVQHEILNVPTPSSHDLNQSLNTMPQVVADTTGTLHVAGARPEQTEVLLDGFEINDPGTDGFNSRVNIDSVRRVTIETGGYGAEYAHAGAGIVALDTQTGDDRFRFGATNFIPDVSFQQGIHFGNWYPRVMLSGPLKKGRVWYSDAVTILHTFELVKELPKGQNIDSVWSWDNLLRLQANLSSANILQGSFLFNETVDPRNGLGPFSPLPTTINRQSRRYFVSLKDQIWVGRTLLSLGAAADTGNNNTTPRGSATYVITPSSTSGNYFQSQKQQSRRLQLKADLNSRPLNWFGMHTFSAGGNLAGLDFSQQSARAEIDYLYYANGPLSQRATFSGPSNFQLSNTQAGGYAQDLWRPVKPVVLSVGIRADYDRIIHQHVVEPRIAMNWVPVGDGRMKLTVAWGEHYQPLNMSVLGQGFDQQRTDVFYTQPPTCTQAPPTCPPPVPTGPPIVSAFVVSLNGLRQPRTYNTTVEWDERFLGSTFAGASFLLRETRDALAWETQPPFTWLLENNRLDRYIAGEVWVRHAFGEKAQISVDYTRSHATSNQVLDPTIAMLILSSQQPGPLLWDAPNRFVSTGWTPIPIWGLLLSGFVEYHTGFPFSAVTQQQQLFGPANSYRYPNYFSLDVGLEKRFHFKGHEWAFRISSDNLTGHENPNSVVNNNSASNFLTFAGGQGRAFTSRLRLVTQH
jgi:carboxypeptidase family protein/TonB-dependent receptor-like protein